MNDILKHRSKKLRRNDTVGETALWNILRNRKLSRFKFRRQHVIEPYIVDFVCLRKKLIIELDGEHHDNQVDYDTRRSAFLNNAGYRVMRFTNSELFNRYEMLLDEILKNLLC